MKPNASNSLVRLLGVGMIVATMGLATQAGAAGIEQSGAGSERGRTELAFGFAAAGSYLVDLDLIGSDGVPFEAQALATLDLSGTAVATDTDDFGFGTGAFFHSPKQGAWKRTGLRNIVITVLEFAYDTAGNLTTIFKLDFDAEFADWQFRTGAGQVHFEAFLPGQDPLDEDETPVGEGEGTFTFRRIEVDV